MLDIVEKRRHSRVDVHIPLIYKQLRATDPVSKGTLTKNLSEGGVRFGTDKFISLSCRMIIEINISGATKPLRAISKVAWIKKLPAGDDYEVGNQFLDMTREDKKIISDFIKKIISQPIIDSEQS